jgi:hypothetical protein
LSRSGWRNRKATRKWSVTGGLSFLRPGKPGPGTQFEGNWRDQILGEPPAQENYYTHGRDAEIYVKRLLDFLKVASISPLSQLQRCHSRGRSASMEYPLQFRRKLLDEMDGGGEADLNVAVLHTLNCGGVTARPLHRLDH